MSEIYVIRAKIICNFSVTEDMQSPMTSFLRKYYLTYLVCTISHINISILSTGSQVTPGPRLHTGSMLASVLVPRQELRGTNPAEIKGPRKVWRIRQEISNFEPDLGLRLGTTKPNTSGTAPTNWYTTIPNDSGPISACFDDDPKL